MTCRRAPCHRTEADRISEFRKGWGPLLACILGTACGILAITFYTQGLFAGPVAAEFGWSRGQFFLGFTIMQLMGLLTAPTVGTIVDKIGPRKVGIVGLIGHAAMYAVLALNNGSLVMFYLSFAGLAVCAAGTLPVTWTTVVNRWFNRNRGLAIGLTMAGTGIAAILAPPYVHYLMNTFGWRGAYLGIGLTALAISLPMVWLLFRTPEDDPHPGTRAVASPAAWGLTRGEALRTYRFWALGTALFVITLTVIGIIPNFVPFLLDSGMSGEQAAETAAVMGIAVIVGRLTAGFMVDRIWAPAVAALFFSMPIIAMLLMANVTPAPPVAVAAALLLGLAAGAELDLLAFLTSRYFGVTHYGAVFGGIYAFFTVGSGLAPLVYARSFDLLGTYRPMLLVAAVLLAGAICLLLSLGRYPDPGNRV
ncbi:MAG: MFS transporter [Gammaproteobacteria bacterium]